MLYECVYHKGKLTATLIAHYNRYKQNVEDIEGCNRYIHP
jgi:phage-related protein